MNIYIIDNHPLMREAVAIQLRRIDPQARVVESSHLAEFAAQAIKIGPPALIVSELELPDSGGLSTISQLKTLHPHCPLIIFSTGAAALLEDAAIQAGADIYIQKTTPVLEIAMTLRTLLSGDSELDTQIGIIKLSKRQKQLMTMLHEGLSNREIAERMGISEHTVKVHLWRLFRKLGVSSRTQALAFGRNNGLI
jgi:DNA-binding NarL/FixJ family response regulator